MTKCIHCGKSQSVFGLKILDSNNHPVYETSFTWPVPGSDQFTDWLPEVDSVVVCESGYHAYKDAAHIPFNNLAEGRKIYLFEGTGDIEYGDGKFASKTARLLRYLGQVLKSNVLPNGDLWWVFRTYNGQLLNIFDPNASSVAYYAGRYDAVFTEWLDGFIFDAEDMTD